MMAAAPDIVASWVSNADTVSSADSKTFHSWFDTVADEHEAVANGAIDFFHRIYAPGIHDLLGDVRQASCLEIGYGGGRLLAPAASVFRHAYGVDILGDVARQRTTEFLRSQGRENFTLLHRDELLSVVPPKSVKFAYSFIVFQHFASVDEVTFYLDALDQLLTDDGCAIVFFGLAPKIHDCAIALRDFDVENPRASTLMMSPEYMLQQVSRKFAVRAHGHAGPKKLWDKSKGLSSQYCVLFTR